jgi:hypothetical protein
MAEQKTPSMQEVKKDNLKKAMDKFGKYLVRESRKNLTRKKKNVSKELYKSIDYELQVMPNSIKFDFLMEEYGEWVDKGRKAGTMPPVSAIEKWVSQRKIQFRDNRGRFESYNSTAWTIAKSIKKRGIPASNFYSRPFKLGFNRLPREVTQAYALDVEDFLEHSINELNKKYKDGSK